MTFKDKYEINPDFAHLFDFTSEKEELKHDAKILMFRFLSEIERLSEEPLLQKDFAKATKTSASFVNQLFKGDKIANLITLAKLQRAFDVTFEVVATPNKAIAITPSIKAAVTNSEHDAIPHRNSLAVLKGGAYSKQTKYLIAS